jgi:hypothetical protein
MRIGRRTAMVAGTFFLAAATGHVMQNADSIAARLGGGKPALTQASLTSATTESAAPTAAPEPDAAALAAAVRNAVPDFPDLPRLEPTALSGSVLLAARIADGAAGYAPPMAAVLAEYDTWGRPCAAPTLTLTHLRPAMIGLAVDAPCQPDAVLSISHAGMSFAARSDADGRLAATIPALGARGRVAVRFETGAELADEIVVPDIGAVRRVALTVRGQTGLHLNAYVKGAGFGAAGHIRPGNDGLPTLGLGGFLTRLGDPALARPRLAEVFTQPALGPAARVEVIAEVEEGNCGRDLIGVTFTAEGTVVPVTGAISFAMPDCTALGDRLVMDLAPATPVASGD